MERSDVDDPTARFLQEVADIRIKATGRDAALLRAGAAMMPVGVGLAVVAWFLSRNTESALEQNDHLVMALIGVTVAIVGVGLFLRYSLAEFLRFWMARLIHQQAVAADTSGASEARPEPD